MNYKLELVVPGEALEVLLSGLVEKSVERISDTLRNEFAAHSAKKEEPEFLTRAEVAKMLGVSLVTLNIWSSATQDRNALLNPRKIGRQVRYDRAEVLAALKTVKKYKRTK